MFTFVEIFEEFYSFLFKLKFNFLVIDATFVFLLCRRNANRQRAYEQLERLKDQLLLQQFVQECEEVSCTKNYYSL